MTSLSREILEQVIQASAEPMLIVRVDHPDWPVVLSNSAFDSIGGSDVTQQPFADVIEKLVGREFAVDVSESLRSQQEASVPVVLGGNEYLLALRPLRLADDDENQFYAIFWRKGAGSGAVGSEMHQELLKAKRRVRDLSRNDAASGLLNERTFYEIFEHDWAVAAREKGSLSVVVFSLDEFDAYVDVFGQHAASTCLRRVGQAIRRCLRRASDVVARFDDSSIVVLSHASDESNVREFAARISAAVRDLGLHHPRSAASRFVTVSFAVGVSANASAETSARDFVRDLLDSLAN